MTIAPIEPVAPLMVAMPGLAPLAAEPAANGFGTLFMKEVTAVNDQLVNANLEIQKLAAGSSQNLHEVMIHMEEARLSFQLLAQVRNRIMEAYQEIMRMQV